MSASVTERLDGRQPGIRAALSDLAHPLDPTFVSTTSSFTAPRDLTFRVAVRAGLALAAVAALVAPSPVSRGRNR